MIRLMVEKKPPAVFKPGEKFEYSNTGYALLASIADKVSGLSFIDFMEQRVFKPLGMVHTVFYSRKRNNPVSKRVYGFKAGKNGNETDDLMYIDGFSSDGGVYSNLADLRKWDAGLAAYKLVSKENYDQALTPGKLNDGSAHHYGFGWFIGEEKNGNRMAHSGGWAGFQAYMVRRPYRGGACFMMFNNGNPRENLTRLVKAIEAILGVEK